VDIDLPRPREIGIEVQLGFGRLVNHIRSLLDDGHPSARRDRKKEQTLAGLFDNDDD
jgi:hypothetical protein